MFSDCSENCLAIPFKIGLLVLNSLVYLYLRISCFRLYSKVMFSVDVGLQVVFFQYFENVLLSLTSMAFSWEIYFHSVCFPSYVHWLFFLNHILSSFTLDFRRCTVICIHIIILGFYLWVASANWFDILSLKIWMYLIAVWTHCQPFTLLSWNFEVFKVRYFVIIIIL